VPNYTVVENLLQEVEIPKDGTLSRTLHRDDRVKIVVFGFAGGQELSQHTAAVPSVSRADAAERGAEATRRSLGAAGRD
jgi:hypothetical protein